MPDRYVLIGSGPGSFSAAQAIRARDPQARITIVGAERYGYYSRPGLAYYLANEVPEASLYPFSRREHVEARLEFLADRATGIDRAAHRVTLESGHVLDYDRLLLSTGSWAIPLGLPGSELDGVVKLDTMHDAHDLIRRSKTARSAVVVGGGITALEIAEGLCVRGVKVHYLMRKDRYWGNVLSESESAAVESGLRVRHVEIHDHTELAEVLGNAGRVSTVRTRDGRTIPCDMVAVAIGVLPQKELAEEAGLACGRGVAVDRQLRSSDPDIFVAGDIAEIQDPLTGRGTLEVLWNTAVAKGRVAGHNLASAVPIDYEPGVPLNVTRIAGFKLTIIGRVGGGEDADVRGLVRGDSETWRQLGEATVYEAQAGDAHVRLALAGGQLAGAVVMGGQALSFALQELIAGRADATGLADDLRRDAAPLPELVERRWREWRASGA